MVSRGRGGEGRDGGVRRGRDGRSDRDRRGRGDGGNRENEQVGASSPHAATQEEPLPSDSMHQSDQPATPSIPPTPPMPPVQVPVAPPPSSRFGPNNQVFLDKKLQIYLCGLLVLHFVQIVVRYLEYRRRNFASNFQQAIQSASSRRARLIVVRQYWQELGPADIQKRRRITYTIHQLGSLPGSGQNQGLPQQARAIGSQESKISSQHPAFNPQNFNAPAPGSSTGQVSAQRTMAGDPNHDQLPEEGRKTTTTAENTGSSHIQRTQPANNITSSTQQASREEPVDRQMSNQTEAQQGTTGECTEDNSDDVDCWEDIPEAE